MATAARAATAKRDRMVVFVCLFEMFLESFTTKDFILFKFVRIKS